MLIGLYLGRHECKRALDSTAQITTLSTQGAQNSLRTESYLPASDLAISKALAAIPAGTPAACGIATAEEVDKLRDVEQRVSTRFGSIGGDPNFREFWGQKRKEKVLYGIPDPVEGCQQLVHTVRSTVDMLRIPPRNIHRSRKFVASRDAEDKTGWIPKLLRDDTYSTLDRFYKVPDIETQWQDNSDSWPDDDGKSFFRSADISDAGLDLQKGGMMCRERTTLRTYSDFTDRGNQRVDVHIKKQAHLYPWDQVWSVPKRDEKCAVSFSMKLRFNDLL